MSYKQTVEISMPNEQVRIYAYSLYPWELNYGGFVL